MENLSKYSLEELHDIAKRVGSEIRKKELLEQIPDLIKQFSIEQADAFLNNPSNNNLLKNNTNDCCIYPTDKGTCATIIIFKIPLLFSGSFTVSFR
jgi:hypothetical protein